LGPLIARGLIRLGYAEPTAVRLTEVARVVTEATGRPLSKQRLAAILKADSITPETLEWIAGGLGLTPQELIAGKRAKGDST